MTVFRYVCFLFYWLRRSYQIYLLIFKALSVASPNSKYRVLGFECSIKAVVRSFSDWKNLLTEFFVGISILEGSKYTVYDLRLPPFSVMYVVWHL